MAAFMVPPRTPSPKVRIRSMSFDSPSSRMSVTPIEDSPYSKSTGSIRTLASYDAIKASTLRPVNILLPLNTKMSDESILSTTSSASSSVASSPTNSESNMEMCADSPSSTKRPHPLAFAQSIDYEEKVALEPASPFLYQDTSFPMYSPWLVRVVLDMYDVHGLDWMSIAEPIERVWGVRTSSADVLDILSGNGRVKNRRWWD
ncbi:hypothetical protein BDW02DRAFT_146464 [Decorospora gaudefroyi]|uniref:Uncharacterized protein n=1 Tax=Decorospora gaudefroyi TaxID=184978 RepID=A0A6A5JXF2_9PLEO|nr:hypothetical protein BDW02DRAFT_146464 [Decorospora gaudefroyi]